MMAEPYGAAIKKLVMYQNTSEVHHYCNTCGEEFVSRRKSTKRVLASYGCKGILRKLILAIYMLVCEEARSILWN